ncbi:MAG TPA: N-6 DNA methylase [Chthoniobacterales bacterium]|nr:N-6 DNA methylase [Chthoniobacterales bacterium]
MIPTFVNDRHEKGYRAVLGGLNHIGYSAGLRDEDYEFVDWFDSLAPKRRVCAVFGQTPFSYDSACFAVFPTKTPATADRVAQYRALGAPIGLEVQPNGILPWRIGRDASTTCHVREEIPHERIDALFRDSALDWKPQSILRAKNIPGATTAAQLEFLDLNLVPALEQIVSQKLHEVLTAAIVDVTNAHQTRTGLPPDPRRLFRLVFRMLAARVLHDRSVQGFRSLDSATPAVILERVADYYGEDSPVLHDRASQQAVFDRLWDGFSFQNLSVDILSYIYENTLVDAGARAELGIHSTPRNIARYIVNKLPFEDIPEADRRVVEPCSGHGVFLVAALKRLRDLLSPNMSGQERHKYFVKMLRGFEIDAFALEVSRLCVTLADFPNHSGWKLHCADIFRSPDFDKSLQSAQIVLCNPPFQDFGPSHAARRQGLLKKPVAVLSKVLSALSPAGLVGFVLPRQAVSGLSYREARERLAKRYSEIEVVSLPDRIFQGVDLETCLLIAKSVRRGSKLVSLQFSEVREEDRHRFVQQHHASRTDISERSISEVARSWNIPELSEVWDRLNTHAQLQKIARIHRGVEWKQPFRRHLYLSGSPNDHFRRGLNSVERDFRSFETPETTFLCGKQSFQRGNAWRLSWEHPKVIVNAVRLSRGPWRLAAFFDPSGLVVSQNFHAVWPRLGYPATTIVALLNSPIAAAYVATHEGRMHIRVSTLRQMPVPEVSREDHALLHRLIDAYLQSLRSLPHNDLELWGARAGNDIARNLLLQIDAVILRAYNLPPRLERRLLDYFNDARTPRRVPFSFDGYFPESFKPTIPLWRFIATDFERCRGSYLVDSLPDRIEPSIAAVLEDVA